LTVVQQRLPKLLDTGGARIADGTLIGVANYAGCECEEDLLAFYAFTADHWPKLRSTNPLERVNREIGRRIDVVGIFPNDRSLIRLAASVVIEQNDEWLIGRRYLSAHSLDEVLDREKEEEHQEEVRELTAA
jgi:hypothetical protein